MNYRELCSICGGLMNVKVHVWGTWSFRVLETTEYISVKKETTTVSVFLFAINIIKTVNR